MKASQNVAVNVEVSAMSSQQSSSEVQITTQSHSRLKPLKLPVFDCNKAKFEDFGALFISLEGKSAESANVKMARLRESLKWVALQAIQGLGISQPEYE